MSFFYNPNFTLTSLSRKSNSFITLLITRSILHFHLGSIFFLSCTFFNPIHFATQTLTGLIKLFVSVISTFQRFDHFIDSICLSLQNLFVYFLKHNAFFLPPFFSSIFQQSRYVLHSNLHQYHRYYLLHHLFLLQLSQHQFLPFLNLLLHFAFYKPYPGIYLYLRFYCF